MTASLQDGAVALRDGWLAGSGGAARERWIDRHAGEALGRIAEGTSRFRRETTVFNDLLAFAAGRVAAGPRPGRNGSATR